MDYNFSPMDLLIKTRKKLFLAFNKLSTRRLARLISFFLISYGMQAQQFKLNQGIALTEFSYQNDQGQPFQGLKRGSGLAFQLSYHKANLVDSSKYKLEQSPFAIYLGQNPKIARLLSMINYDLGIQFNQLNAVGDIQNTAFSYQTDYIGLQGKLGFRIQLPFACSINLQGIASVNKIVHGNQLLLNRYVDLNEDPQFSQVKLMAGYGAELERQFSGKIAGFVAYQQSQTLNSNPVGLSTLNFTPSVFSIGIRFLN
jgi:hypothetical protein